MVVSLKKKKKTSKKAAVTYLFIPEIATKFSRDRRVCTFCLTAILYSRILHQSVLFVCSQRQRFNVPADLLDITLTSNPVARCV